MKLYTQNSIEVIKDMSGNIVDVNTERVYGKDFYSSKVTSTIYTKQEVFSDNKLSHLRKYF